MMWCPGIVLFALSKLGFYLSDLFSLPSSIFRVREHKQKGIFNCFFTSKYVIISSKTYQLHCIERYFGRKGSLLPSYCPPLIMDPKSMLVELRPLTRVELRAVVELRSLSSRRKMVPWHRVICPFHAWFLSFGPLQPPI